MRVVTMRGDPLEGLSQRQLPQNLEAEQALLGALFHNNGATLERCPGLLPEHFADPVNGRIFREAIKKIAAGGVADALSIKSVLANTGVLDEVGGTAYLASIMAAMVAVVTVSEYAQTIMDAALRRKLIEIGTNVVQGAFGQNGAEVTAHALEALEDASDRTRSGASWFSMNAAVDLALAAMERAAQGLTSGISTGFGKMDARLGGLEPGMVYVIAGRPAMGKSALGHQIALNAARSGVGVLELSLEMPVTQVGMRSLATAANVPLRAIKSGAVSNDLEYAQAIVRAERELRGLSLSIADTAGQTPSELSALVRRYRRKHPVGLILIDHLNLMRADDKDARNGATWAVERASGTVLEIAKREQCPVILLAQLNRGVETREDKRPGLADLRQAGAIEQDAYAVGFVYREEYYLEGVPKKGPGQSESKFAGQLASWNDRRERSKGKADLIWAKVRDGEAGTDRMTFHGPTLTFGDE